MNKIIESLALVAMVATALVSCNKEKENVAPEDIPAPVSFSFTSENPNLVDADTRTVYTNGTIEWSEGDKIRVGIRVGETWMAAAGEPESGKYPKLYVSDPLTTGGSTAQFKVPASFTLTNTGTYKFYGIYPSAVISDTDAKVLPSVAFSIPAAQSPASNSFDKAADVMYAESEDYPDGIPSNKVIGLTWSRIVSHADITLKKLPTFAEGETVTSIEISAQEGADLVGPHLLNIINGVVSLNNGVSPVNKITVNGANLTVDNTAHTLEFWFTSLPFTATSLKVVLTTNKKIYTKEYTGISKEFLANRRNTLGIGMSNATEEDAATTTISAILADDEITTSNTKNYSVAGATVMAVQGKNYIIGDATGVILMYYSASPALEVGKQYDVQGKVKLYNGVHEFDSPTVQASTGTAPAYGTPDVMTVASLTSYSSTPVTKYAKVYVWAQSSGYVCSDGTNSVNVYDGTSTFANYYGKPIIVTGYLIGFYNSKINMIATAIEQDTSVPFVTRLKESISVAVTAVTDATESEVYSLANATDDNLTVTPDGTIVTAATVAQGVLTYSVSANTGGARSGYVDIAVSGGNTIRVTVNQAGASGALDPETLVFSSKYTEDTVVKDVTISGNNYSISFAKGEGSSDPKYFKSGSAVRIYAGNIITIAATTGSLSSIEFTCNTETYATILGGMTFSSGSASVSGTAVTWSGEAASLTITNSGTTQTRISKIVFNY